MQGIQGDASHLQGKVPTSWDVRVFAAAIQSLLPSKIGKGLGRREDYWQTFQEEMVMSMAFSTSLILMMNTKHQFM